MYDVAIIIINYNTKDYVADCIKSLVIHTSGLNYEILIIDNNSSDEFDNEFISNYSNLRYMKLGRNYGFSKAVNRGISNTDSKYIFLMNPDTLLVNNSCKYFYDYMELPEAVNVWCCGGILLDEKLRIRKSYGEYPTINQIFLEQFGLNKLRSIIQLNNIDDLKQVSDDGVEVPFIIGADMFIRRESIEKIGCFNEAFFLNYEEAEISVRANNAGYRSIILPKAKIIHYGSKSFPDKNTYLQSLRDGELIFFKVTQSKSKFIIVKIFHLLGALMRFIFLFDASQLSRIKKIFTF